MGIIEIKYFSDVLCVWAYISQVRIDAIKEKFERSGAHRASLLLGIR
jgi:predicted DsbA family dithiol-disulfide isomerase